MRAWVLGFMLTFGWCVGGLALLMVQYVTGGKWGLLLRRPMEAMTRTVPLVALMFLVEYAVRCRVLPDTAHMRFFDAIRAFRDDSANAASRR